MDKQKWVWLSFVIPWGFLLSVSRMSELTWEEILEEAGIDNPDAALSR